MLNGISPSFTGLILIKSSSAWRWKIFVTASGAMGEYHR